MKLGELIARETQIPLDAIMLLRHGNDSVADLRRHGATVEEFSAIHPSESRYDFLHPARPPISVVTVIADDRVYGVFRVMGVEAEGTSYELEATNTGSSTMSDTAMTQSVRHRDVAGSRCSRFRAYPSDYPCEDGRAELGCRFNGMAPSSSTR